MKRFTKNEWNHLHDCIFEATYNTTKKNCNQQELEEIFKQLPEHLQHMAFEYGMNDTVFRDHVIEWYEKLNK